MFKAWFEKKKAWQDLQRSIDPEYDKKILIARKKWLQYQGYDQAIEAYNDLQKLTSPEPLTFNEVFPNHQKNVSKGLIQDWSQERELI